MKFLYKLFTWILKFTFTCYLFLYISLHLCFLYKSNATMRYMVFQNFITWPFGNLSNPQEYGLDNVYNFFIESDKDIQIGVWHFLPNGVQMSNREGRVDVDTHFTKYLTFGAAKNPTVIYVHGNIRDRSLPATISLCTRLSNLGYHVFAIDYRGYGDSTGTPSEKGVVNDVLALYDQIKSYSNDTKIYLWGHSLGTGIVSHTARVLSELKIPPSGVILEAPFLNISQAATQYVISPLFYNNDWIISKGNQALQELNMSFNTEKNIVKIDSKILIFHAEDDWLIPHDRGLDLLRVAKTQRPKDYPQVELMILDREHGLGHCNIYQHEEIYPRVQKFIVK